MKPFRAHELDGAFAFEQATGKVLKPSSSGVGDFQDVATGAIYDHLGQGNAMDYVPRSQAVSQFKNSITKHIGKLEKGVDELIIDLKGFNKSEITDLKKFVGDNVGAHQGKVNYVNDVPTP